MDLQVHTKYPFIQPVFAKQMLKSMRLTLILLFTSCMQVSAKDVSAQITLSERNTPLTEVIQKIQIQSGYDFVSTYEAIKEAGTVTVKVKKVSLQAALDACLKGKPLTYLIIGKTVVIRPQKKVSNITPQLETEVSGEMLSTIVEIKGRVTDENGNPLAGVSVTLKGSKDIGTATDENGNYSLALENADGILIFTAVGHATQEIKVNGRLVINVVLQTVTSTLEDVVLIGYGDQKRQDVTGAVGHLKIENTQLQNLPNPNVMDAVKGRMPGFDVGAVTNAGGNPSITIRGQNSIRASNTPLLVVDGVIFIGSLNEINPNDVASIDILKDAASAAIFGSRGNAGVIMITTKRGHIGEPNVNFRLTTGYETYTRRPKMRTGESFLQYRRDYMRLQNNKVDIPLDQLLLPKEMEAYNANHTVDWWDAVVKPGPFQDYQVNFSGGTKRFNYYVSGDYLDQRGVVFNDNFKKFIILSKLDAKITDWFEMGLNLSVINKNADGVAGDLEKATINGPYGFVHSTFSGYENWYERYPQSSSTTFSPFWRTLTYDEDRNQNYRSNSYLRFNAPWIKGLSYTFNYSLNRWEGHASQFNNEKTFVNTLVLTDLQNQTKYLVNANGYRNNSERTDWYLNHLINYNQIFGVHSIDVTLVAERQESKNRSMSLQANDFSSVGTTVLGVNALQLGDPTKRVISTGDSKLSQLAYLARINYGFRDKINLSGSIRKDGYSGFAEGNKYGVFKAVSGAYTISNEKFFKNNFVNYLKLRLSYGETGNPSIGAFATFPSIGTSLYLFGTDPVNTSYVNVLANKSLSWEKTGSYNLGLEFGILGDIIRGEVNYYGSKTSNLLLSRSIPSTNGFTRVNSNIGKVGNRGFELQINSRNIEQNGFKWTSNFNFWLNRNRIISLYGLDGNKDGKEDDDISNSWFIGKSLSAVYDYTFDGIVQESDTAFTRIYGDKPGDIKLKDLNGNNKIDPDDRTIVGYTKPNYTASFGNTISYKGFELYFLFFTIQGGGKNNWYIASNNYALNPATLYPQVANWLDKEYWMPEHPSNSIPKPNYVNKYGYRFTTGHSFIRLQDLSFGYNFNAKILKRTPLKNLKAYISAKNLATWTKWDGLDPETSTTYASVNGFPVFKIITLGISATF